MGLRLSLGICGLVLFGLLAGCLTYAPSGGMKLRAGLTYDQAPIAGGSFALKLDAYSPAQCNQARPTILYFHGGGFIGGDRAQPGTYALAEQFVERGFNFLSASYRLAPQQPIVEAPFTRAHLATRVAAASLDPRIAAAATTAPQAAMADMVAAMTWIEANSARLCHAPGQLILMGQSAGAITALNVTYAADEVGFSRPAVAAVASDCGGLHMPGSLSRHDVPLILVHGARDLVIPLGDAERTFAEARASQTPAKLLVDKNSGHCVNVPTAKFNGLPLTSHLAAFFRAALAGEASGQQRLNF